MLDVAWPELIVIGAVALVAIGPKDLPKVMYTLGQWAGKARGVMNELRQNFEQLTYEAEIADKLNKEKQASTAEAPPPPPKTDERPGTH